MAHKIKSRLALVLLLGTLLLAGCGPEASRTRGGGLGGDIGNRDPNSPVEFHGETDPSWDTPIMGQGSELEERLNPNSVEEPEGGQEAGQEGDE